jgi:hypothetical protein
MTTKRLYQKRHLPDEALGVLLRGAGSRYDPLLVKAFANCMGVFPIGSAVQLGSGELGVVVATHRDPERIHQPMVKRVMDASRRLTDVELCDLSHPAQAHRAIVRCVDPEDFGLNAAHFAV